MTKHEDKKVEFGVDHPDGIYKGRACQYVRDARQGDPGWGSNDGDDLVVIKMVETEENETVRRGEVAVDKEDAVRIANAQNPESFPERSNEKNLNQPFAKESMRQYDERHPQDGKKPTKDQTVKQPKDTLR